MLKKLYRFFSPRFQTLFLEYPVSFQPRYGHGQPPHPELYAIINAHREQYALLLQTFLDNMPSLQSIRKCAEETNPLLPCWNNGFLPGLDIAALYSMIQKYQPKIYLEIGSGNSTKVAKKAIADNNLPTKIISIDPAPRVEIDVIADEVLRIPFEKVDTAVLNNLKAGDIIFVDNSHRVLPNSDAMVFFMEILPRLAKNTIVHLHDIYLPYDYPPFMCDRFYSEQYLLAAFLLANPQRYQPILPCFFISEDEALRNIIAPLWEHPNLQGVERHGGSFWLEIW